MPNSIQSDHTTDPAGDGTATSGDEPETASSVSGETTPTARRAAIKSKPLTDPRLPKAGTIVERTYKGKTLKVTVTRGGFVFMRNTYASLSGLATELTGNATNGFLFFGLTAPAKATGKATTTKAAGKPKPTKSVAGQKRSKGVVKSAAKAKKARKAASKKKASAKPSKKQTAGTRT